MQPRNPAVREGLIFGAGLAVLFILNFLLATLTGFNLGGIVTFLAALAAYLFAGIRAGRATGRVQSGLIAGLVAGLFASLVNAVVVVALSFVFIDKLRATAQQGADAVSKALGSPVVHYTNTMVLTSEIFGVLLGVVFASAIGLGLGALGGNIGKSRAPLPQQTYQESLYQGIPAPPAYPPVGEYPPLAPQPEVEQPWPPTTQPPQQ